MAEMRWCEIIAGRTKSLCLCCNWFTDRSASPLRYSWDPLEMQRLMKSSSTEGHTQQVTPSGYRSRLPLCQIRRCYTLTNSKPVDSVRIGEGHTKGSWAPGWDKQEGVKMRQKGGHHSVHHYTNVPLPWRYQMGQERKKGRKKETGGRGSTVTKEVNKESFFFL